MTGPRFAAQPRNALKRVPLGGLEAIYHIPSGITHLLAEPVPDLLDMLATLPPGRSATADEVLTMISQRFDIIGDEPDEAPESVLAERLAELAALGLVVMLPNA